jgi:preprotein translocase subunit SecG
MGLIGIILIIVLVISAALLVLVVLVQDDQGEGIGGIFGGGSNTAFGSRSGNVLTRVTSVLAAIFLVCCFGVAWVSRTPSGADVISKARQQALNQSADQTWYAPTSSTPAAGATGATGTTGSTTAPASAGNSTTGTGTTGTGSAPAPASTGQGGQ